MTHVPSAISFHLKRNTKEATLDNAMYPNKYRIVNEDEGKTACWSKFGKVEKEDDHGIWTLIPFTACRQCYQVYSYSSGTMKNMNKYTCASTSSVVTGSLTSYFKKPATVACAIDSLPFKTFETRGMVMFLEKFARETLKNGGTFDVKYCLPSHQSISRTMPGLAGDCRAQIASSLQNALLPIFIQFDGWKHDVDRNYLRIVGTWLDPKSKMLQQETCLACKEIQGQKTGAALAEAVDS